jgi:hypothetical protein
MSSILEGLGGQNWGNRNLGPLPAGVSLLGWIEEAIGWPTLVAPRADVCRWDFGAGPRYDEGRRPLLSLEHVLQGLHVMRSSPDQMVPLIKPYAGTIERGKSGPRSEMSGTTGASGAQVFAQEGRRP